MMTAFISRLLLVVGLAGGLLGPVAAQTARIAHLSHSGSVATLADAASVDNFGEPMTYFIADSIRLTSDTTALEYGRWYHASSPDKTHVVELGSKRNGLNQDKREIVRYYQQYHPKVKLIGFDSTSAPSKVVPPVKTTQKGKRRKAVGSISTPAVPPQHSGMWLGTALLLGLAGAGWLLGERRPAQPQAA